MASRVALTNDLCRIAPNQQYAWRSGPWHQAGLIDQTYPLKNGYAVKVQYNPILIWWRIFTRDGQPPDLSELPPQNFKTLVKIHEWVPGIWPQPSRQPGWFKFGTPQYHGITNLDPNQDYHLDWSQHARRHLRHAQKSGVTVRFGNFEDIISRLKSSQVPRAMGEALATVVLHRLQKDPETIEILVAEVDGKIAACFVSGNDDTLKESMYLLGYFVPEFAKYQAMTLLIDVWFSRTLERGYRAANFGAMSGPYPSPFDPWIGLSNFKTHFNIERVHLPPGYWKIGIN